jgi:hypothetical protein
MIVHKTTKIIGYYAVAMLNYRQPKGDLAWKKMLDITDAETVSAIAFLTGFSGGLCINNEKLLELAKPVMDEFEEVRA